MPLLVRILLLFKFPFKTLRTRMIRDGDLLCSVLDALAGNQVLTFKNEVEGKRRKLLLI